MGGTNSTYLINFWWELNEIVPRLRTPTGSGGLEGRKEERLCPQALQNPKTLELGWQEQGIFPESHSWEKIDWLGTVWRGQQKKDPQGISVFPSNIE